MAVMGGLGIGRIETTYVLGAGYLTATTVEVFRPEDVISSELIGLIDNFYSFFLFSRQG